MKIVKKWATFSDDARYRFDLVRIWRDVEDSNLVAFIGLKPDRADDVKDSSNITRCFNAAVRWGFDGMVILSLFPLIDFSAQDRNDERDMQFEENDFLIEYWNAIARMTVALWGNDGVCMGRSMMIRKMIPDMYCLGVSERTGEPNSIIHLRYGVDCVDLRKARLEWGTKMRSEHWAKTWMDK